MIARDQMFGCELVTFPRDRDGYGMIGRRRAHVVAWQDARGPVPDGHEIDHLCRRRNCQALHHLEPVTRSENEKRKSLRYRLRRTKCPSGHDLTQTRAITDEGGVTCRTCNQEAIRAW